MLLSGTFVLAILSLTTLAAAVPSLLHSQDLYVRDPMLHTRSGRAKSQGSGALEPGSPSNRQGSGSPLNLARRPSSPLNTPRRPGSPLNSLRGPASPSTPRRPTSPAASQSIGADTAAFISSPARFGEHRRPLHADFRTPGGPVADIPQQFNIPAGRQSTGSLSSFGSLSPPGKSQLQGLAPVGELAGPRHQLPYVEGHEYHLSCEPHSFSMPQTILDVGATRCEEIMRCHRRTPVVYRGSVEGRFLALCREKCQCVF